jgi:hypothetical protein
MTETKIYTHGAQRKGGPYEIRAGVTQGVGHIRLRATAKKTGAGHRFLIDAQLPKAMLIADEL